MEKDIFEDMRRIIGCMYISDLRFCKCEVWEQMKLLDSSDYSRKQLNDFCRYLFNVSYETVFEGRYQENEECKRK